MKKEKLSEEHVKRLEELKHKMFWAKDLGEPQSYFMDLSEEPGFVGVGEPKNDHPFLRVIIPVVAEQILGTNKIVITELLIIEIKEHKFYHGGCFLNGKLADFIYTEDINIGICAVVESFFEGKTTMVCFSKMEAKEGEKEEDVLGRHSIKH